MADRDTFRAEIATIEKYAEATYARARQLRAEGSVIAAAELEAAAFGMIGAADTLRPSLRLPDPPPYRGPVVMPPVFLMYAFRYALGRLSYSVGDVASALIEHKAYLQPGWREQIIRDVDDAVLRGRAGHDADVARWLQVAQAMRQDPDAEPIADLVERSSFGTPAARAARARVPDGRAAETLARVKAVGPCQRPDCPAAHDG